MQRLRRGHQHFHDITAAVISLGHPLLTSRRLSLLPDSALRSVPLSFFLPCQYHTEAAQELVREECGGTAAWHRQSTHTDTTEFKEKEGERVTKRCCGGIYVSMRCWDFLNKSFKCTKEKTTFSVCVPSLYEGSEDGNVTTMVQIKRGSGSCVASYIPSCHFSEE